MDLREPCTVEVGPFDAQLGSRHFISKVRQWIAVDTGFADRHRRDARRQTLRAFGNGGADLQRKVKGALSLAVEPSSANGGAGTRDGQVPTIGGRAPGSTPSESAHAVMPSSVAAERQMIEVVAYERRASAVRPPSAGIGCDRNQAIACASPPAQSFTLLITSRISVMRACAFALECLPAFAAVEGAIPAVSAS